MTTKFKKLYTPHESHLQNGIYLVILVVVGLILWPLAPKPNPNAVGVLLPQGQTYSAIDPSKVAVVNTVPPGAQFIGHINTKVYYDSISMASNNANIQKDLTLAKQLAAQEGANIIVINKIGRTLELGPLDGFMIYAGAYHD